MDEPISGLPHGSAIADDNKWAVVQSGTTNEVPSTYLRDYILGYKVYSALISQTTVSTTSGLLVSGKTYNIGTLLGGDDFSNVGYVSDGANFVATGTTPAIWNDSTVVVNITDSAPTVIELQNTIGKITPAYLGVGAYNLTGSALFVVDKTFLAVQSFSNDDSTNKIQELVYYDASTIKVSSFNMGVYADGIMTNVSFEIRVYN